MPTSASNTFSVLGLEPAYAPELARTQAVRIANSLTLTKGTVIAEKIGTNAKHRVTITGAPTGGTFTLTAPGGGNTTAGIAFGASAQVVQAALEALASIGQGNVIVTGGWNNTGAVFDIEFVGALANAAQTTTTCSVASLTGGAAAQSTSSIQTGAAGTPGQFAAYDKTQTDGRQVAKMLLQYDVTTDGSGNHTVGGGEHGETYKSAPAYTQGYFFTADLTGLDATAVAQLGRLLNGTVNSGILKIE